MTNSPIIVPVSLSSAVKKYPDGNENIGELSLMSSVVTITISESVLVPSDTCIVREYILSTVASKLRARVVEI